MTSFRIRSSLAITAAAAALAMPFAASAQADNSNSAVAPAPSGNATMIYGGTSSFYGGPYYGNDYSRQAYADERARQRAYEAERRDPNSEESIRRQGWSNVDPATGTVTAPGYMGPKDATK